MRVILFDLPNHLAFSKLSIKLREEVNDVHDVSALVEDLPTGNYQSSIDQIWYVGQVMSKLADMFSANMISENAVFVLDTSNNFLLSATEILSADTGVPVTIKYFKEV